MDFRRVRVGVAKGFRPTGQTRTRPKFSGISKGLIVGKICASFHIHATSVSHPQLGISSNTWPAAFVLPHGGDLLRHKIRSPAQFVVRSTAAHLPRCTYRITDPVTSTVARLLFSSNMLWFARRRRVILMEEWCLFVTSEYWRVNHCFCPMFLFICYLAIANFGIWFFSPKGDRAEFIIYIIHEFFGSSQLLKILITYGLKMGCFGHWFSPSCTKLIGDLIVCKSNY